MTPSTRLVRFQNSSFAPCGWRRAKPMTANPALPSRASTAIALRFVGDLQTGKRPSIEAALDQAPAVEWSGLLHSLLIAEVNYRRSHGEMPVAREYLPRFPAHTEIVRSVVSDV